MANKLAVTAESRPVQNVDYDTTPGSLFTNLCRHAAAVREAEMAREQFSREAVQWLVDRGMHEMLKIDMTRLARIARSER